MSEDQKPVPVDDTPQEKGFRKYLKLITIEPVVVCWLLPFLLTYAATENILLEKACRGYADGFDKDICKIFVRKDSFDIECDEKNVTSIETINQKEIVAQYPEVYKSIENNFAASMNFLCEIEEKVQQKLSGINAIRNPIAAIGPLIIILFAGPWSDKKNLRVPCMIVPFLGEAIGYFTLFISAIFINGPVEFPAYSYRLIPSLTGSENLMTMAIFSYLSAISTEENRTLRFGMFQILNSIIPIFAQSLSPTFNDNFEYAQLFGMMIPVHIIGLIYAFVFLKEVKQEDEQSPETAAYDNPAMETDIPNRNNASTLQIAEAAVENPKNFCVEFFDPRLAKQCITCFLKKREYGIRSIIALLMLMHFIVYGVAQGETQNMLLFQRAKLNWDIDTNTYHTVFSIVLSLIGTLLMIGVLSKYLKIPDIILTIISTVLTLISRFVYSVVTTTAGFFTGTAIDFTFTVKLLTVRSIISKLVPTDDLSTMFAVMGLFEAFAGVVFPWVYPTYYQYLLSDPTRDVSEMFMMSAGLMLICLITYSLVYRLLKTKDEEEAQDKANDSTKL